MLATSILALQTAAARAEDEPPYFRAENSDVESAVEGVKEEEKVAISSTSSTDPGTVRDGGRRLPAGQFKTLKDDTLAYSFSYPVSSGEEKLPVVLSRRPERYSSAAPLAPDARQRIVSELVDFSHGLVISLTVGPPSGLLKGKAPAEWRPKDVANTVLIDRSTARVTEGQRVVLQQVENVKAQEKWGTTYWTYEHLSQGSPNMANPNKETFRHAIAVTAWRAGLKGTPYLYTLNLSCPDDTWDKFGGLYQEAADSFKLLEPSKEFIQPDKDPWRFF